MIIKLSQNISQKCLHNFYGNLPVKKQVKFSEEKSNNSKTNNISHDYMQKEQGHCYDVTKEKGFLSPNSIWHASSCECSNENSYI